MTTQITGEVIPANKPGTLAMAQRKPLGACLGIAPWNAPVILGVRAIAMAVACGNTAVLKASELCPATHMAIGEAFRRAGFPDGVLNVITNAPEEAADVVSALISAPEIRHINFTGSTSVGRIIAQKAAAQLKPVLLELGGKAPMVVLDDADLEGAVNGAAFGAFMNQGQICMSTEKVVVEEPVADAFAARFAEAARALPVGDPEGEVAIGACVDRDAIDHVAGLIEDAVAKGAVLLCGGAPEAGVVMEPTILDHVTPAMRIYAEESFGPVTAMIRARDADHAVEIANDTPYGLSAAVFGQDIRRAMEIAQRIQSGICHINGPTVFDEAQMPFGGVKASGYGRFGGTASIPEFTELRWITVEDPAQTYPL